jgi:hypothetical protein
MEGGEALAVVQVTRRAEGWKDRFRAYHLLIDGHKVGRIRRGEVKRTAIRPGQHMIQLKIDWVHGPEFEAELSSNETLNLICAPADAGPTLTRQ